MTYVSDSQFIETGVNEDARIIQEDLKSLYRTARALPNGNRNCYKLGSVNKSNKYLIRAHFEYGNYDGKNNTPGFGLYMGVNLWRTISFSNATDGYTVEIIVVATMSFISVCLVNTGYGTPFISGLELRPLNDSIYPDDVFDRYWWPEEDSSWISFGTSQYVTNKDKATGPPSRVMMTAVCPLNNSDALYYFWTADESSQQFHVYLHFAELKLLGPNMTREFTVCCGNNSCHNPPIRPEYLVTTTIEYPQPLTGQYDYSCSITKTPTSTLPPILNAIEIFIILPLPATPTREEDGILDGNPDLCVPGSCSRHSNKQKITILIAASVASVVILSILLIILRRFKWRKEDPVVKPNKAGDLSSSEKRRFTYAEVMAMTNNFERSIGKGGFGTVYHGQMPDGTQVAVKMLSQQSVKLLSHTGQGTKGNTKALNWGRRLRIALDIAQG
ncbi:hypothetical protein AAC387_Pa03g4481 [Persea americana]